MKKIGWAKGVSLRPFCMEGIMPRKPKKPCRYPGCPNLTDESYCPEHKRLVAAQYNRYERTPDMKKRYKGPWPAIRRRFLAGHPLCEMCLREGMYTEAREVHHILPLADGGSHDTSNLMALCKPCHSRITATEGGRWGKPQGGSKSQNR
jgi:5-methylcytosine-specific restriction protein A